jgi:hypothetical protein
VEWLKVKALSSSPSTKRKKKTYNGEKAASSTNVARKTGYLHTEN